MALPMASTTIANCTAFRMPVSRARWYSMAETKVSMRATKASACCADRSAVGRGSADHWPLSSDQSRWTSAKAACDNASRGTKSGRVASPVRSTFTLWSNCAIKPATCGLFARANVWARRQVCIRILPASLTAAAPPSSCQVTHKVSPIDASASSNRVQPIAPSLEDRLHERGISALYWRLEPAGKRASAAMRYPQMPWS